MIRFYSENLCYDIDYISESLENDSFIFNITKSVYGDKECKNILYTKFFQRRLHVDDEGNVYTTKNGNKKWFNWHTQKPINHYSMM